MGMTMTEKILARASGRARVEPGENIWVNADVLMTHDVCGPGTIGIFHREFGRNARVWDPDRVVLIPDHYIFTSDEKAHRNIDILREFAREQGIRHFYDVGGDRYKGVCHVALPEEGHTRPGEVLFGTDSHTCTAGAFNEFATGIGNTDAGFILGTGKLLIKVPATMRFVFHGEMPPWLMAKDLILQILGDIGMDGATYRAMEFVGETVGLLPIEERMTLANMAIEGGAKSGICEADEKTFEYLEGRTNVPFEPVSGDPDARVVEVREYNTPALEPVVACPSTPDQRAAARSKADVRIDRAYIGSCTGGKLGDFLAAAKILDGRRVAVPTYIVPATTHVRRGLYETRWNGRTLAEIFEDSGCIGPARPSCAACLGGPVDTFGRINRAEICISTTNRNFTGRMGSKEAQIYLASPLTVAASAVRGHITDPREFVA